MRNEENFWKEFLKNQKEYDSEIFGGLKPLYFTSEQVRILEMKVKSIVFSNKFRFSKQSYNKSSEI